MPLIPHLLTSSLGVVLLLSSPLHGSTLPEGWVVAPYSDTTDLRHSKVFEQDASQKWRVELVDGKVVATNHRFLPEEEVTWENSGMLPKAQKMALRLGRYLVDQQPEYSLRLIQRVSDGWLVGFNAGEWGGGLCWVSMDGSKGRFLMTSPHLQPPPPPPPPPGYSKKLWAKHIRRSHMQPGKDLQGWLQPKSFSIDERSSENVLQIEPDGNTFLVVQGLDHMGLNRGKVMKVARNDQGEWIATHLAKLDGTPRYFAQDTPASWLVLTSDHLVKLNSRGDLLAPVQLPNAMKDGTIAAVLSEGEGQWLVLTEQHLYRLSSKGDSRLLLSAGFMCMPEMNSMVRTPDGTVFIGMRHYLLRLVPKEGSYAVERLEPIR